MSLRDGASWGRGPAPQGDRDGRPVYAARSRDRWFLVLGDEELGPFTRIEDIRVRERDGSGDVAWLVATDPGRETEWWVNAEPIVPTASGTILVDPSFNASGGYAFLVGWRVLSERPVLQLIVNGQSGPVVGRLVDEHPNPVRWLPDGSVEVLTLDQDEVVRRTRVQPQGG